MTRQPIGFRILGTLLAGASLLVVSQAATAAEAGRNWPQWRGPLGTGEAPGAKPPLEWSETKNVRWKVALPGAGKSSPIVWGDLVLLTTAEARGGEPTTTSKPGASAPGADRGGPPRISRPQATFDYVVLAYGRADGRLRWRAVAHEERPHEGTHPDGSYAPGSVLTDGERVFAFFGSRGLYAFDMQGRPLWQRRFGLMETKLSFGEGASPALSGDTLVVPWDHEGEDFVVALDAKTGREKWRTRRDEPTTWATPHVVVHDGRAQVVLSGTNNVRSYDLATGAELWHAPGLTANAIPTPVSADGMLYATSGFRGNALRAVSLADAKGAVVGPPALAWSYERDTPYVPSPLLYRGALYFLKSNSGILTSLDARTGASRFSERLEAVPNVYASPVAADGRIYLTGRDGATVVLGAGPRLELLATNRLDDAFDASAALVDGEIYLRGARHLYRISEN